MSTRDPNPALEAHPLKAYADGELSAPVAADVAGRVASDAEAAAVVRHQHQLKSAVARAMDGSATPEALREQVQRMVVDDRRPTSAGLPSVPPLPPAPPVPGDHDATRGGVLAVVGRWMPTAVAAVLLLAAWLVFDNGTAQGPAGGNAELGARPGAGAASEVGLGAVIPARLLTRVEMRHLQCGKNPETLLNDPTLPQQLEALPDALASRFEQPDARVPSLDLGGAGYVFDGVGPCHIVGTPSVHLVYHHRDDPGRTISLWVRPDDRRLDVEPGRIYALGALDEHPVLIWRSGGMVYFIVGDADADVRHAAETLAVAV